MRVDVVLATFGALPDLDPANALLIPALAERGLRARPAVWNDSAVDWSRPRMTVIRSTWDYHHQRDAFLAWVERIGILQQVWNPPDILRWNTHKFYLRDLEEKQVAIVPTAWLESGTWVDLRGLMQEHRWQQIVIKPAVSASAYGTVLVTKETISDGQSHLDHFLSTRDMLIQPFVSTVASTHERSLVYIDGVFTHAVERMPALDLPRSGTDQLIVPTSHELIFAERILGLLPTLPLYARVDLIRDEAGELRLMELELVEPTLWLDLAPHSVQLFADAIASKIC